jgi:maltose O-acetyltransferase
VGRLAALRHALAPQPQNVTSRAWAFQVNVLAASPLITRETRRRIYRRNGIDVESDWLEPACYIHSNDIWIGPEVYLNYGVHIENVARVEIGARTGLGVQTTVITSNHAIGPHDRRLGEWHYEPVTIGAGCWIAARSTILPGVTIGDGCIVGAGSVVKDDCEPDAVYAGVPARKIRDL